MFFKGADSVKVRCKDYLFILLDDIPAVILRKSKHYSSLAKFCLKSIPFSLTILDRLLECRK